MPGIPGVPGAGAAAAAAPATTSAIPGVASPFAPAGATAAAAPAAAAAAPAPNSIFSFFGLGLGQIKAFKAHCKETKLKLCQSPLGKIVNSAMSPVSLATGGLIPPCCPPEEILMGENAEPGSAGSVASEIAKSEAEAKERAAALKYLGTVDCRYWPDAEKALVEGLRADTNECVRLAAAQALARGCCCTEKVRKALELVITGSDADGNPRERSPQVIYYSRVGYARCGPRNVTPVAPTSPNERPELPDPPARPENPPGDAAPTPPAAPPAAAPGASASASASAMRSDPYLRQASFSEPENVRPKADANPFERSILGMIAQSRVGRVARPAAVVTSTPASDAPSPDLRAATPLAPINPTPLVRHSAPKPIPAPARRPSETNTARRDRLPTPMRPRSQPAPAFAPVPESSNAQPRKAASPSPTKSGGERSLLNIFRNARGRSS